QPARETVGVAAAKKEPLPMPPPSALPARANCTLLGRALTLLLLPPWARLSLNVLLAMVTEPPSFHSPPPMPTPARMPRMPLDRVTASPLLLPKPLPVLLVTPPAPPRA